MGVDAFSDNDDNNDDVGVDAFSDNDNNDDVGVDAFSDNDDMWWW